MSAHIITDMPRDGREKLHQVYKVSSIVAVTLVVFLACVGAWSLTHMRVQFSDAQQVAPISQPVATPGKQ